MIVRAETANDYAATAEMVWHAFAQRLNVPLIITLSRQHPTFDPDLSLVAEVDGRIIGHGLFMPHTIRLMDTDVRVVMLSPLGVDPAYQKQGAGSVIMREGHKIAEKKGFALAFLIGHDTYYPRFGYITGMYGASSVTIPTESLSNAEILQSRAVHSDDLPALVKLWEHDEARVDFAIRPSASPFDWLSPNTQVNTSVYLRGDQVVGYTRIHQRRPAEPLIFYAADHNAARGMAAIIGQSAETIKLPLHPASASAGAFEIAPSAQAWSAGMACALNAEGQAILDAYQSALKNSERAPGRALWGTQFEL